MTQIHTLLYLKCTKLNPYGLTGRFTVRHDDPRDVGMKVDGQVWTLWGPPNLDLTHNFDELRSFVQNIFKGRDLSFERG